MKTHIYRLVLSILLGGLMTLGVMGCKNTSSGVGDDIEEAGDEIEEALD